MYAINQWSHRCTKENLNENAVNIKSAYQHSVEQFYQCRIFIEVQKVVGLKNSLKGNLHNFLLPCILFKHLLPSRISMLKYLFTLTYNGNAFIQNLKQKRTKLLSNCARHLPIFTLSLLTAEKHDGVSRCSAL